MSSPLPLPYLTAEQLTIGYRRGRHDHSVAERLAVSASPGQLIGLLGPNGCGKSTLLRTLAGMQPPLSGRVLVNGHVLTHLSPARRATHLAVVLSEATDANLSVYDLVATGRYPYTGWFGGMAADDERAVCQALEQTNTQHFVHRPIGSLSDGERQRVMIARAVAQDTPLLILDEPTAHLDVSNRVAVLRLLLRLAHEHQKTVLLSTHALDLALLMVDQLWLMHAGQLQAGVPEDLVLRGELQLMFEGEGVTFDRHTGTFGIARPTGRAVRLEGASPERFWTRRALERTGYAVVNGGQNVPLVRVLAGSPVRWVVEFGDARWEESSIAAVLDQLGALKTR